MKKFYLVLALVTFIAFNHAQAKDNWPDGTPISDWFRQNNPVDISSLGEQYIVTEHGVKNDSSIVQTKQLQAVIDRAAVEGGVVVIPKGAFLSGSLFFKQGTHLHLQKDAVLKGNDDISNFPIKDTHIEGQSVKYFAALVNIDKLDGFTISGERTINGNGLRYWKSFWLRRQVNPKCTNVEELKPRLVYISNSKNVTLSDVRLINSPFWTTHLYKSENVKLLNLYIYSSKEPVKAPSTNAIDIDVCKNVHVKGCYMSVNDDACTKRRERTNGG